MTLTDLFWKAYELDFQEVKIYAVQIETRTKERQTIWRTLEGSAGWIRGGGVYPSVY